MNVTWNIQGHGLPIHGGDGVHPVPPDVVIVTYCQTPSQLYGSLLVFHTLRRGFPTARVHVYDNGSLPEARAAIVRQAEALACQVSILQTSRPHDNLVEELLHVYAGSPRLVFVDPDVVFWQSVEEWTFPTAVAGRLLPRFFDEYTACVTMPRLHTSLWFITRPASLLTRIRTLRQPYFNFHPFRPLMIPGGPGEAWTRYDTGAALYQAVPDEMTAFSSEQLDAYDHLFCGTHWDRVRPWILERDRRVLDQVHRHAREGTLDQLKGIWRMQEAYLRARAVPLVRASAESIPC